MIKVINVNKTHQGMRLLKNINIQVKSGQIYGLIGSDNARKSLLIKVMIGLVKKTSGEIYYDQELFHAEKHLEMIGICSESVNFYTDLSGYDNIKMYLSAYKIEVSQKKIIHYFKMFNLYTDMNLPVRRYSQGMVQKLRLIRTFIIEPKVIILDEPTKSLDPIIISVLKRRLKSLSNQGVTIFIATSMLSLIGDLADVFGVLHYGEMIETISSKELYINQKSHLEIQSSNLPHLLMVLERSLQIYDYEVIDENLVYITENYDQDNIVQTLYAQGVKIDSVRFGYHSFEQYFLDKIGV